MKVTSPAARTALAVLGVGLAACTGPPATIGRTSATSPQPTTNDRDSGFAPRPVSRDPVVLEGTVIDEVANSVLARVQLRMRGPSTYRETSSDSLGRFHFQIDSAGLHSVEAQADGYIAELRRLHVDCGNGTWNVEGWSPASCPVRPHALVVRMRPWSSLRPLDASIRGRVVDEQTGRPLVAQVMFASNSGTVSSETGEYSLPGRAPGVYLLQVRVVGYEDEDRLLVVTCPDGALQCTVGGAQLNFSLRLRPWHP